MKKVFAAFVLLVIATLACGNDSGQPSGGGVHIPTPTEELWWQIIITPAPTKLRQPTAIPEPTSTKSPLRKLLGTYDVLFEGECYGLVCIDTCADDVLLIRGQALQSVIVGDDWWGLIVVWLYDDAKFEFRERTRDGVSCYRVHDIYLKGGE